MLCWTQTSIYTRVPNYTIIIIIINVYNAIDLRARGVGRVVRRTQPEPLIDRRYIMLYYTGNYTYYFLPDAEAVYCT